MLKIGTIFVTTAVYAAVTIFAAPVPVTVVHPGDADDVIITANNTVNATATSPDYRSAFKLATNIAATPGQLPLSLINNLAGSSVNAYVTGLNSDNQLVILQPDGTFFFPTCSSSANTPQRITAAIAIPLGGQGHTTHITIPQYISAARIWFAEGDLDFYVVYNPATDAPSLVEPSAVNPSDPSAGVNWGFVEFTYTEDGGLYANISYVDFVGLALGISLEVAGTSSVQSAHGLLSDTVSSICSALKAQASLDGQPWDDLCMVDTNGNAMRIIAPSDYVSSNPSAFGTYWNVYIDEVWNKYSTESLAINTQSAAGNVTCTVQSSLLTCGGDNRGYAKPTAGDIFGCNSGPFSIEMDDNDVHRAVVPRLCAAFHRSTLLSNGGNTQPGLAASNYYQITPTNWYSKFVHEHEVDGRGYAFPYDDVNPDGGIDQSGVVASPNPQTLTVTIGGPSS